MYVNFFGLDRQPFNITPDPSLLYSSPSHREALAALTYGITERKGCMALIGEVGVGKTTVLRSVLEKLPSAGFRIIHLFNAAISFDNLLRTILRDLGNTPPDNEPGGLVDRCKDALDALNRKGITAVLVIDEAQNMPVETLRRLHLLFNLESGGAAMIQIIYSGQPEFEDTLSAPALRQLRQRIAIRTRIVPLTRNESAAYMTYRLRMAGHRGSPLFTAGAVRLITREAAGIPRVINTLCDNCLITAFGKQKPRVGTAIVREIVSDFNGGRVGAAIPWRVVAPASVVILLGAAWLYGHYAPIPATTPIPPIHNQVEPVMDVRLPVPVREVVVAAPSVTEVKTIETPPAGSTPAVKTRKRPHRNDDGKVRSARKGSVPVHKVARKGDTLTGLVLQTYGSVDKKLIEAVRHNNPRVTTIDDLQGGERIYFPSRDN